MDTAQLLNVLALAVAFAAVVASTALSWRALRLTHNANHLPVVLDALEAQRTAEFATHEITLWEELPNHDVALGFTRLPEPLRGTAFEVACYYQHLSALAEYGFAEWDLVAVQVSYRMQRTWTCIEAHVHAEREYRGGEYTFLNTYETFAAKVAKTDIGEATERLHERGRLARLRHRPTPRLAGGGAGVQ
ncbi:hypothetical protein [Cryptosporangium sp. NPDC048952]|uniref:hypothetical protein n=1 Tax=Cryptosporangium sp. NPDC048952 TaxID=3363961 RepID=UPI00371693AD